MKCGCIKLFQILLTTKRALLLYVEAPHGSWALMSTPKVIPNVFSSVQRCMPRASTRGALYRTHTRKRTRHSSLPGQCSTLQSSLSCRIDYSNVRCNGPSGYYSNQNHDGCDCHGTSQPITRQNRIWIQIANVYSCISFIYQSESMRYGRKFLTEQYVSDVLTSFFLPYLAIDQLVVNGLDVQ